MSWSHASEFCSLCLGISPGVGTLWTKTIHMNCSGMPDIT